MGRRTLPVPVFRDIFGRLIGMGCITGIWNIEAMGAAHPVTHKIAAPTTMDYWVPESGDTFPRGKE